MLKSDCEISSIEGASDQSSCPPSYESAINHAEAIGNANVKATVDTTASAEIQNGAQAATIEQTTGSGDRTQHVNVQNTNAQQNSTESVTKTPKSGFLGFGIIPLTAFLSSFIFIPGANIIMDVIVLCYSRHGCPVSHKLVGVNIFASICGIIATVIVIKYFERKADYYLVAVTCVYVAVAITSAVLMGKEHGCSQADRSSLTVRHLVTAVVVMTWIHAAEILFLGIAHTTPKEDKTNSEAVDGGSTQHGHV